MSTQTPTAYIEITLEETATQPHVPATLYYHEEKKVFLKPVDLSRMLEDAWEEGGDWANGPSKYPSKQAHINSVLNPPK